MIRQLLRQLFLAIYARLTGLFGVKPAMQNPASEADHSSIPPEPINLRKLDNLVGLDARYLTEVEWPVYRGEMHLESLAADPVYQSWRVTAGGQKWSQYFGVYRKVFGAIREKPLRILEIGVHRGASLSLWKNYFSHPQTQVIGIDIHPSCQQFDAPAEGKHVRIGSQTDLAFLENVVGEFGPFDLIIDDGSHNSADTIISFNGLFDTGLKDSGIYFVEDLHTSYWARWRTSRRTFIDFCNELVEHAHCHYRQAAHTEFFVRKPLDHRMKFIRVPRITTMIEEIRFFDSMIAVQKARREHPPYVVWLDD